MHRLYPFVLLLLLLFIHAAPARDQAMLARITVYWHNPESTERVAAVGSPLCDGHCAVDPKKIPYGSRIELPDAQLVAVDTGPAVVQRIAARRSGRTPAQREAIVIDRYFESRRDAQSWAASHPQFMTVRVNSPELAEANFCQAQSTSSHQASVVAQLGLLDANTRPVAGIESARKVLDNSLPSNTLMKRVSVRGPLNLSAPSATVHVAGNFAFSALALRHWASDVER
jgi:3D (Asp-Asp-Asp) domain-containing protein